MAERNSPLSQGRGKKNQDKISLVRNRAAAAKQLRDSWQTKYRLEELYDRFYGDVKDFAFSDSEGDFFLVNKFWPTIKTLMPSLFLQNPSFNIRSKDEARSPESVLKAKMAEAGLKAIAEQEHHLEFSIRLALLQSFFSIGIIKCSYDPRLIPNPRSGEEMLERTPGGTPILNENQQVIPLLGPDGRPMVEPAKVVDDETYRWNWINGDKMLLPDSGPDHLRWPWIAEEVTVLLEDAREDTRFPSNLRSQLRSNSSGMNDRFSEMRPNMGVFSDDSRDEFLTYIEMWDIRRRRQMIWVDGQTFSDTQFLLDRPYPEGVEEHPYAILGGYTPIIAPRPSPWPLPHTFNWLGLQKEYNIRRHQMMNAAKRSARKVYYDQSTFPDADQAVAALQSQQDMEAVMVNDQNKVPVVQVDPAASPNIAQDVAFIDSDWNRTTGVSSARSGGGRGRNTATETVIENSSGEARDLDMRHAVNIWLTVCGSKMLQLLRGTLTLGMYVKMRGASDTHYLNYVARQYGPDFAQNISQFPGVRAAFDQQFGDDRWQVMTREELEFEADVSVAPGSARPRNMENEKQDFFQLVQLLGAVPILTQSRALLNRVSDMFDFIDTAMIDEILAAGQKATELEQIKAGRTQGGDGRPAAEGGGANISEFRRNIVG